MSFLDFADLRQIGWKDGRAVWITLAPLRYRCAALGTTLLIPAEFVTDLASVPRVILAYWIAGGRGTRSSLLHDFPYQFGYWLDTDGARLGVDKATVDREFHRSLRTDPISGAGPVIAQVMYRGVQIGGRGRWNEPARTAALNPIWTREGWLDAP